ncbi:MAG: DNA polymerase, partial [Egibacteraceae bacterium]
DIFAVDIADDEDPAVLSSDGRHSLKPLSEMTGSRALVQAEETLLERFVEFVGPRPRGSEKAAEVREWMGRGYSTLDVGDPAYWVYNGLDAVFCLRVLRWLLAQWEGAPGDIRRLLDRESRLGQMLAGVTWRGLRVDRDALGKVFFAASTAQTEMLSSFGPYGVTNPDSAPQVAAALEELGVVDPVMSDAGQISTDKKAGLPRLRDPDQPDRVRELAELLVVWRGHKALRMKTREIDRISVASIDGRVHPKVNALKARTSRMSISDPALQNLPKNDPRIRAVFQAEDGHLLVGADFGQVEYRVAAALSRDPDLFEVIVSGEKLHNANARRVYGEGFTEKQYGQAKNGGFSVMYGAGPKRIAATFGDGTTLAQAQQFLESFRDAYPVLGDWIRSTQRHNEIVSLSGRRTAVDPDKRYANTNYHIQGAARDLFADALLRLRAAGWGDALWLVIHDEIILQVPEARAQDACAALEAAMTCTFRGVPITAEAKVLGTRWSEIPEVQADQQTTNRKAA